MLQWKDIAAVRRDVRWWHIAFMTAQPKSPILHLSAGGKPWPRGLARAGRIAQTPSEETPGGDPPPPQAQKCREREFTEFLTPSQPRERFTCHLRAQQAPLQGAKGRSPPSASPRHPPALGRRERGRHGEKKGGSYLVRPLLFSALIITAHPLSITFSFCTNN